MTVTKNGRICIRKKQHVHNFVKMWNIGDKSTKYATDVTVLLLLSYKTVSYSKFSYSYTYLINSNKFENINLKRYVK